MALFGTSTDKAGKQKWLRLVQEKGWADAEGRNELLRELAKFAKELRPDEIVPLVVHTDGAVRSFGEKILRERLDARMADVILKGMQQKTGRIQSVLLNAMARANPDVAVPQLLDLVSEGNRDLALRSMEALSSLPPHKVGNGFLKLLGSDKREIRHMAIVKVHESGALLADPGIRRAVLQLADDEEERVRLRVLEILKDSDPGEAVRHCLVAIKDPSPAVQQRAVQILGEALGAASQSSDEADEQLLSLLTDGSEAVRNGVLDIVMRRENLGGILRKLLAFCKNLVGWARDRTIASLRNHSERITAPIIEFMDDEDEDVRAMALMVGATLESPETVPHVIKLLKDPDWWIRMIAAETLGNIGDRRAVPALLEQLADQEEALAVVEALARIGDPAALRPLAGLLTSPDAGLRAEVVDSFRHFDPNHVVPLLSQVKDRDPASTVRRAAERVIRDLESGARPDAERREVLGESGHFEITAEVARVMETLSPLERLLVKAREMEASDLHVVVGSPPVVRVHGELTNLGEERYTPETAREAVEGLLGKRDKELFSKHRQVDLCHAIAEVGRYRVNVYEERRGISASFRVIPNRVPTMNDVGLPSHLGDLVSYHQGLVLVAGPSGSGKSTTLAALVNLFNERLHSHILVFEDPIEFVHPLRGCLVNQRAIGVHSRSFSAALRAALREDPDIIIIGDLRDLETVRLAIEASETGHLVIGTMNTTSAPKTVDRVIESFPVAEQTQVRTMLSDTLKAVVAQQLVPRADGKGRVACFEVMMGTLGVRNLIRENKVYQIIGQMQIGESHGHITVDSALARLVEAGQISAETAWLKAQNKENFEARVNPEFLAGHAAIG